MVEDQAGEAEAARLLGGGETRGWGMAVGIRQRKAPSATLGERRRVALSPYCSIPCFLLSHLYPRVEVGHAGRLGDDAAPAGGREQVSLVLGLADSPVGRSEAGEPRRIRNGGRGLKEAAGHKRMQREDSPPESPPPHERGRRVGRREDERTLRG